MPAPHVTYNFALIVKNTREKDMRNREEELNKLCHKPKEFPPFKAVQYFPLEEIIATHLEPGMA